MAVNYLSGYPETLQAQVAELVATGKLKDYLLQRYPEPHDMTTDKALYQYVTDLKQQHMRHAMPLSKVQYDNKIKVMQHALGLHTAISRVQGGKLKAKAEIRVATLFKTAPEAFLNMIVVHELAHLKEKEHDKNFYKLCRHMAADYHQLEFDTRVYLLYLDTFGPLYDEDETRS